MYAHTRIHLTINKLKIKRFKNGELSEREITILMMRGWGDNDHTLLSFDYLMTRIRIIELINPLC